MSESAKVVLLLAIAMSLLLGLAWLPVFLYENFADWHTSGITRVFSSVCHQQPDRMFSVGESYPAVCSRCSGIYTGFAIGLWVALWGINTSKILPRKQVIVIIVVITVIIGLDILAQWITIWEGSNFQRAVLGLIWGLTLMSILITRNK